MQGCLAQELHLHEEIYNHPSDKESKHDSISKESKFENTLHGMIDRDYKCRSLPLPIPHDSASKQEEREREAHQELMDIYNGATWKMYYRIQNARKVKNLSDRKRSHSEGLKSRLVK